jgi:hypothetical protein
LNPNQYFHFAGTPVEAGVGNGQTILATGSADIYLDGSSADVALCIQALGSPNSPVAITQVHSLITDQTVSLTIWNIPGAGTWLYGLCDRKATGTTNQVPASWSAEDASVMLFS